MAPRARSRRYKDLPPNLYFDKSTKFYKYKRPDTGQMKTLSRNKIESVAAAKVLNAKLIPDYDLVDKVMGVSQTKLSKFLDEYWEKILPQRNLSENTLKAYKMRMGRIKKDIGNLFIDQITVLDCASMLNAMAPVMAIHTRSVLIDIMRTAMAQGLADDNPAAKTLKPRAVKKRKRLTIEMYEQIHSHAEPFLQRAMEIALHTLQRAGDVIKIKRKEHIKDGCLYIVQSKTEKHGEAAYLKIKISPTLQSVIDNCIDDVPSPFLIHRRPKKKFKCDALEHWTQVTLDTLEKYFRYAREAAGCCDDMEMGEKPTFHEIRSLGIHLYEKAGVDAQKLAGHKSRLMTDLYKTGHEIQWTEVDAGLDLAQSRK